MGRRPQQTFFQRSYTDGQQTHEKMLIIANYQRNANQYYNEVSPHTNQNSYHQEIYRQQMMETVQKKETFLHCWWECKLVQPLWKRVWRCFRKLKTELPYDLAIPLLSIFPDKIIIWKDTQNPMFKVALFTIAKT